MGDHSITLDTPKEMSPEELKAAAEAAPTTMEEAQKQLEAEKAAASRPEGIPEKFWDAEKGVVRQEELLKAYAELESKLGSPEKKEEPQEATEEKTEDNSEDKPKEETEEVEAVAVPEVVKQLTENYEKNGDLTDADYALAEKAGITREMVDQYRAGQEAVAAEATRRITEAAGGQDNMERMFAWAKTALKPEQIDEYNSAFAGGDVNAAVVAMENLRKSYSAAVGKDAKMVSGKATSAAVDVYQSQAQLLADINDPKYRTDPAFREAVAKKLAASSI